MRVTVTRQGGGEMVERMATDASAAAREGHVAGGAVVKVKS
jgi:hypothetical protein